jgi:hypothetical protein
MEQAALNDLCSHIPGLAKRLGQFYESFFTEDYDGILLLTYPRLYNLVPKERMREKLYETFHNKEMDVTMDMVTMDKVGKLVDHNEGRFVKIDYTLLMAVRFKEDMNANLKKKKAKSKKQFMLQLFEERYGKENSWFEETTRSYCFHVKNSLVGIEDEVSPHWTFLTIKKGPMMEAFLPDEVRILFESEM